MSKEKQIESLIHEIRLGVMKGGIGWRTVQIAEQLHDAGYRKQSEVIDEFANRLKATPIKCGLPLLGLSTKKEIEEYFNGIMLQVRDAIDNIAEEMKGV